MYGVGYSKTLVALKLNVYPLVQKKELFRRSGN